MPDPVASPPSSKVAPTSPRSGYSRSDFEESPDDCDLNARSVTSRPIEEVHPEPSTAHTSHIAGYSRADFVESPNDCDLNARSVPARPVSIEQVHAPLRSDAEAPIRVPASIGGFPVHSMIVPIAIGCFLSSLACDLLHVITGDAHPWNRLAYLTLLGGIVSGVVAAVPGYMDMQSLPPGRIRKIALIHMRLNITVLTVAVVNAVIRYSNPAETGWPLLLSVMSIMVLMASGWLGARLVAEAGVGLDETGQETIRGHAAPR
ncbi:MAG: DUF2231 domain-containing protein [Candidatus Binatia bacterium]